MMKRFFAPSLVYFIICAAGSLYAGTMASPTWVIQEILLDVKKDSNGKLFYIYREQPQFIDDAEEYESSELSRGAVAELNRTGGELTSRSAVVFQDSPGGERRHIKLVAERHWRWWSLIPAITAIGLCWMTREPLSSLAGGVISGALILSRYDVANEVLIPSLSSKSAATVLLLYLWLLGGLMGIWSRTGAAYAFAEFMSRRFVRGPRTAKLTAWMLGILFFQGGTISTVLVGTAVKPIADKERISHEELSYIVDSTASPIASQLAFNAWPGYIQGFIYVAGVSWLATETDRIVFFFKSVPFCFYAIFAVLGTFLLSIDKAPFLGSQMKAAIRRARETGELDAPNAQPLFSKELQAGEIPEGYTPHVAEFLVPLVSLIGIAVGTFIVYGSPEVVWAFTAAVLIAMAMAYARGMNLYNIMNGYADGLKGVVLGSVILLLAITIGSVSKQTGGGLFMVELLGDRLPYWTLPVMLQILTVVIAFSTGTSWGTYAVTFPLAMPLSYAVAMANGLDHPELFMTICFAAVMDGSVFGDQCSPISDTTVLSSICTGCDLMDHVRTQLPQASIAAVLAAVLWTAVTFFFV